MADDRNTRDRDTHTTRETHVERDTGRSGSSMAFIVGGLVVAVLIIAYVLFGLGDDTVSDTGVQNDINVEAPDGGEVVEDTGNAVQDAGNAIGDAAEDTGNAVESTAEDAN